MLCKAFCLYFYINNSYFLLSQDVTNHASTTGYVYKGCFNDKPDRDVRSQLYQGRFNIQQCYTACSPHFKYFSLQYGSQCFCGNSFGKYGASNACGMNCVGQPELVCGDAWMNNVFGEERFMLTFLASLFGAPVNREINSTGK
jgi:hypothetical protein